MNKVVYRTLIALKQQLMNLVL